MADNYLEKHREDYENRKKKWLAGKSKTISAQSILKRSVQRFNDD